MPDQLPGGLDSLELLDLTVTRIASIPGYAARLSLSSGFGLDRIYLLTPEWNSYASIAIATNLLYIAPWLCPLTGTLSQVFTRIVVPGAVGSVYRFGVYDSIGIGAPFPNNLLFDSQQQDGTVAAVVGVPAAIPVIKGNVYFGAYLCGVAAPTVIAFNSNGQCNAFWGTNAGMSAVALAGARIARAFGPLPTTFPVGALTGIQPSNGLPIVGATFA